MPTAHNTDPRESSIVLEQGTNHTSKQEERYYETTMNIYPNF